MNSALPDAERYIRRWTGSGRLAILGLCLALIGSLTGCAARPAVARVEASPQSYAWWLRTRFAPQGTALRGVPVQRLDAAWCRVDELTPEMFRHAAGSEWDVPDPPVFAVHGVPLGKHSALVLLAVYATCEGQTGTALVALDPSRAPAQRVLAAHSLAEPAHWAMLGHASADGVDVVWCMACDDFSSYRWNPALGRFEPVPEDHGEAE